MGLIYIFLLFIYTPKSNFSFNFLFLDLLPGLHRISILEVKSESCKTKNRWFKKRVDVEEQDLFLRIHHTCYIDIVRADIGLTTQD